MTTKKTRRAAGKSAVSAVVIKRIIRASRDLVFKAWTQPRLMKRWWGPKGFTTPVCRIDLRPGGDLFYCMQSPEGQKFWGKGVYREIIEPERVVVTDSFADAKGNTVPASHYGMSDGWPLEMLVTTTFDDYAGKTKLTLKHTGLKGVSAADRRSMRQGWTESFDKLEDLLQNG